ncbi:MAG: cysteine desulfurase family protein [Pseudomonadota bacterium]
MTARTYLDWNATAPLRPEAREAMLRAMEAVGNPSSVHAEGRAAKKIVEDARRDVAALVGCEPQEIVFTSGATEAAALGFAYRPPTETCPGEPHTVIAAGIEHDCVAAYANASVTLPVLPSGRVSPFANPAENAVFEFTHGGHTLTLQAANSETGVLQDVAAFASELRDFDPTETVLISDMVQSLGKIPVTFRDAGIDFALVSAHKFGGPKGIGALIVRNGIDLAAVLRGGGQEMGRRSGTENVIGAAGFGAAAAVAHRLLLEGAWQAVAVLRDRLEARLARIAPELIVFGKDAPRLPNTSCFAVPGWRGETQVIQMDLAGFAISAGSACSSGKVKASRVLMAMGFDEETAGSAIRVSLGPTTMEAEVMAFADAWEAAYTRRR